MEYPKIKKCNKNKQKKKLKHPKIKRLQTMNILRKLKIKARNLRLKEKTINQILTILLSLNKQNKLIKVKAYKLKLRI